ncbi:MAG: NAD(P)H-dependent oxidoreductase [Pacificimonas sp.]|jgi:NAD(P)H dehydrogenase (quinone)|nr:NAD(P)H-dependent oxidoreductase [Pacificimonas sp.]
MNILILDGHPDSGRLSSHFLDVYEEALGGGHEVTRIAVRDLDFDPVLHGGYARRQDWEPDVERVARALDACDHLVVGFPMWWGGEPAALKGLLDRMLLPGFGFAYHEDDPWWDKLLAGRSADVLVLMDTPPFFLRLMYGNPVLKRWKGQILGFTGIKPQRVMPIGSIKGDLDKKKAKWERKVAEMAASAPDLKRAEKVSRLDAFLAKPPSAGG